MPVRRIIHLDMDAFFASVEQLDFPELRGRPVIVGGPADGRGVVAAASYEARKFGVRSAIPSAQAARLCPHGVFVRPRFERYKQISFDIMSILREWTDLVEPLSLDEAYLDVTENRFGVELARDVARELKDQIKERIGLTASAGVAPNKLLAKIASDYRKPDGLTVVAPERVEDFLRDLPVRKFWGVGPSTEKKLADAGIVTATDLKEWTEDALSVRFGRFGRWLYRAARGEDDRPVNPERERKSLGAEDTFSRDVTAWDELLTELARIAVIVSERLAKRELPGGYTVTLKVTYAGYEKISRAETLDHRVNGADELASIAGRLLERTEAASGRAVRLLGISVSGFEERERVISRQLELPFDGSGWE